MHDFYGTVFLRDDPDSALDAKIVVDLNRIVIKADDAEIGSWRHGDVKIKRVKDQIFLDADGETLVLELEGTEFFLDLLGVGDETPRKSRRSRRKEADYEAEKRPGFSIAEMKTQVLEQSADPLDRRLAILMAAAAAFILIGAALTWGPFRLMDPGSFPIGRLLAAFGGLGGLLAVYLAYFDRSRVTGSAAAIAAGVVTFIIMYLYARSARLGIGFILSLLGSQTLIAAGVLGIWRHGDTDDMDDD